MRSRIFALALSLSLISLAGCGKKDEKKGGSPDKGTAAETKGGGGGGGGLIGKWKFEGMEVFQAFNSKGRVKVDMPGDMKCLGAYQVTGGSVAITYDPGQESCMDGTMAFKLKDGDNTLDFMGAVYKRVDKNDDTSF